MERSGRSVRLFEVRRVLLDPPPNVACLYCVWSRVGCGTVSYSRACVPQCGVYSGFL